MTCSLGIADLPGTLVTSTSSLASNSIMSGAGSQASQTTTTRLSGGVFYPATDSTTAIQLDKANASTVVLNDGAGIRLVKYRRSERGHYERKSWSWNGQSDLDFYSGGAIDLRKHHYNQQWHGGISGMRSADSRRAENGLLLS